MCPRNLNRMYKLYQGIVITITAIRAFTNVPDYSIRGMGVACLHFFVPMRDGITSQFRIHAKCSHQRPGHPCYVYNILQPYKNDSVGGWGFRVVTKTYMGLCLREVMLPKSRHARKSVDDDLIPEPKPQNPEPFAPQSPKSSKPNLKTLQQLQAPWPKALHPTARTIMH